MKEQDFAACLNLKDNYDLVDRVFYIGGRPCHLYYVDGFINNDVLQKIMEYWQSLPGGCVDPIKDLQQFSDKLVPYGECYVLQDVDQAVRMMLSGPIAVFVQGLAGALLIDIRHYPTRGITEPENDKVLRGPRDGFCETVNFNTGMVRRRIRDTRLIFKAFSAGQTGKSDVVVGYMDGLADKKLVEEISRHIEKIDTRTMIINQQNLCELLLGKKSINPFPKAKSTERPDVVAHNLAEGRVVIFVDNFPGALILPTYLADFTQQADDFYFSPSVGWYIKTMRLLTGAVTLFVTPLWLCLAQYTGDIPRWLAFVRPEQMQGIPLLAQLLLMEFAIDGLRLASLNTPSPLASSMSIVGGLILGDFAVSAGIILPHTVFYMAFVSISTFSQPSLELGYAIKMFRMLFLVLAQLLGLWGVGAGTMFLLLVLIGTKTVSGHAYLYPFIPFDSKAAKKVFARGFSLDQK